MRVDLYETSNGQSPVEKYIESLPKADQARFAEVLIGLEEQGLAYNRAQFRQLRGKLWEVKFASPSGGVSDGLCSSQIRGNGNSTCI